MPTKYVDIRGTPVHYFHTGSSTLPAVPPSFERGACVILIHGEGGNGNLWQRQLAALGEAHSPLAFDFPGHGRSGGTESLGSVTAYAGLLAELITALGLPPAVLVGHSLGAAIALELAATQPARVRALSLVGWGEPFAHSPSSLDLWRSVMQGRAPQPFTMEHFSPQADGAAIRATFMEQVKTDPRVRYFDMLACNQAQAPAGVDLPLRVVAGADDQLVSLAASRQLANRLKGEVLVIEQCGHTAPLEKPDQLNRLLSEFLSSLP
jgi:pimeloyl-ACP methyl ester carboxylesterase